MKVWIVESGDYEQRGIDLVAASLEAAVGAIKATYKPPYIVEWGELEDEGEWGHSIQGKFTQVVGYSVGHTKSFDIQAWEVKP